MDINLIFNYLSVLAIPTDSDFSINDIENHYRMLSKMYHPDMKKVHNSNERFILIKEARDFLVNNFVEIKQIISKLSPNDGIDEENDSNEFDTTLAPNKVIKTRKTIYITIGVLVLLFVVLPFISLIIMLIERR